LVALLPVSSLLLGGCGDDSGTGGGGGNAPDACADLDVSACTVVLSPSDDDTAAIQGALIEDIQSGDTLCLCPGTYALNNEVQVATPDVTIRGVGASRDAVVLDFADQLGGDDAHRSHARAGHGSG